MVENLFTFFAVFGAGLVSFFSPCVIPLIPAYVSYLTGVSVDRLREGEFKRTVAFSRGFGFVLGFSVVFIIMGAAVTYAGQLLYSNRVMLTRAGGVMVFLAGLHLMGAFPIKAFMKEHRIPYVPRGAGFITSFLLGTAFAAGWTPCVGPVLSGVLVYAASSQKVAAGVVMLGIYSLGFAVPFLATAMAIDYLASYLRAVNKFLPWISKTSGLILVLLGILLFFDRLAVLTF